MSPRTRQARQERRGQRRPLGMQLGSQFSGALLGGDEGLKEASLVGFLQADGRRIKQLRPPLNESS